MADIGLVGLGTMGEPIANNLRKAGHELTVWNRTRSKADHIVSKGGKLARTPRECASGKDLVFTCVSDEKALDAGLKQLEEAGVTEFAASLFPTDEGAIKRTSEYLQSRL